MPEAFDAYYQWLGIPPAQQPADHYRLLGLAPLESDVRVIRAAVEQRFAYLRTFQLSKQAEMAERLLNEVSAAKTCLLDPQRKGSYDGWLRGQRPVPPPLPAEEDFPCLPDLPLKQSSEGQRLAGGINQYGQWILVAVLLMAGVALNLFALLRREGESDKASSVPAASGVDSQGSKLTPPGSQPSAEGGSVVRLGVVPSGALVRAQQEPGKPCFGFTAGDSEVPVWLVAGKYQLRVEKDGYFPAVQELEVFAIGEQKVMIQLQPRPRGAPVVSELPTASGSALPPDDSSVAAAASTKNPFKPAGTVAADTARASESKQSTAPPASEAKPEYPPATAVRTMAVGSPVAALAFRPGQTQQAVIAADKLPALWDVAAGKRLRSFRGHRGMVSAVVFTANGEQFLSASEDRTAVLWDVATARRVRDFPGHIIVNPDGEGVLAVAGHAILSSDGEVVLVVSGDEVIPWDVASGMQGGEFQIPMAGRSLIALSPDHLQLITGQPSGAVLLWMATAGRPRGTLQGHKTAVTAAAFSPDGQHLATGSGDHTVCLWTLSTLERTFVLQGHTGSITTLAYSPDGRQLLTGSDDQTAILWDTATGQPLQIHRGHRGRVTAVAFSSDGRQLLTGSLDGTAILWNAP